MQNNYTRAQLINICEQIADIEYDTDPKFCASQKSQLVNESNETLLDYANMYPSVKPTI